MSTSPEIVRFSETISQTTQEGLGVGGQVIAKSEMPGIGHSGETRQPGQEGLRLGQNVRMLTMPEGGQSDVETRQPVVSGSTSEMSVGAAFDCDLNSEQMGGVHSKGQSSDAATKNPNGLDEISTAGPKLQSVSEKKSVEVQPFEASKDPEWFDTSESVSEKKSVEVKLSEAKNSEWFDAIEKKNCKLLLQLFRSDRSLWVQTGLKGRSVLHVAVMQGCSELVRELHEGDLVPCGKNLQTPFEFLWENARDGRLKDASAQDIWLVMEGPCVKIGNELLSDAYLEDCILRHPELDGRSQDDYLKSHVMCRMFVDSEMLRLRELISRIASEKKFVMDENDVDFNFEDADRKELYVHMACNMLRNVDNEEVSDQITDFIMAVINNLLKENLVQKLFDQTDGQGRTILQIVVLSNTDNYFSKCINILLFKEILDILPDACVNSVDKAGRTILHWAVAHCVDWAVEQLWVSSKINYDDTFQTQYYWNITPLNLILLYSNDVYWINWVLAFMTYNQLNGQFGRRCVSNISSY